MCFCSVIDGIGRDDELVDMVHGLFDCLIPLTCFLQSLVLDITIEPGNIGSNSDCVSAMGHDNL